MQSSLQYETTSATSLILVIYSISKCSKPLDSAGLSCAIYILRIRFDGICPWILIAHHFNHPHSPINRCFCCFIEVNSTTKKQTSTSDRIFSEKACVFFLWFLEVFVAKRIHIKLAPGWKYQALIAVVAPYIAQLALI